MGTVPKKPVAKPHKCQTCGKAYASTDSLRVHNRSAHLGIMFCCVYSGYESKYTKKSSLKTHVESAHKGAKFVCPISDCQKVYAHNAGRYNHMQSVHKGVRLFCQIDDCQKVYAAHSGLNKHIKRDHEGFRYACEFSDCQKTYTSPSVRNRHVQAVHQGVKFPCQIDGCQRIFSYIAGLNEHIKVNHDLEIQHCPWDDCQMAYSQRKSLREHIDKTHFGIKFPCEFCQKIFSTANYLDFHIKSIHGTPEDAAELREKKLQIRQHLAEKEAQGVCSATKTCQNPAINGSFCYQRHEKFVDSVAKALKQKTEEGHLAPDLIRTADEFALLLQRQIIYLDPESKAALHLLARGFDDDEIAAKSYDMDSEFYWTGQHTAMDITIERLNDGKEIISTRVDLQMDIEELEARCPHAVSRAGIRKVYGRSDKT